MLSLSFCCAGVLDDQHVQIFGAEVLEVVQGSLGCEHEVVDVGFETLVVAVSVDEDPECDAFGDQIDLPRAGMPVRFANTAGLQRNQLDAGLLTDEYRKVLLVCLLLCATVIRDRR